MFTPNESLIPIQGHDDDSQSKYKLYKRRFLVLTIFTYLSFNQSLFWLTFSPIGKKQKTSTSNMFILY
jgi:hypothetical protein